MSEETHNTCSILHLQLHIQHLRVWLYLAFFILAVMHEYNEQSRCGKILGKPARTLLFVCCCCISELYILSMRVWQIWADDNMEKGNTWQWGRGWCWFSQAQSMRAIIPVVGWYDTTLPGLLCHVICIHYTIDMVGCLCWKEIKSYSNIGCTGYDL